MLSAPQPEWNGLQRHHEVFSIKGTVWQVEPHACVVSEHYKAVTCSHTGNPHHFRQPADLHSCIHNTLQSSATSVVLQSRTL